MIDNAITELRLHISNSNVVRRFNAAADDGVTLDMLATDDGKEMWTKHAFYGPGPEGDKDVLKNDDWIKLE